MQIASGSTNVLAPAPQSTPTRDIRSLFEKTPWLRSLQIGDRTAGELVDQQLQFGVVRRAGAGNGYALIPHTTAALRYLHSDAGTRLNGIVDAMLGTSSLRGAKYQVQGISLATDRPGYVLNTLMDSLEWGDRYLASSFRAALADPAKVPAFKAVVQPMIDFLMARTAANFEYWINLDERTSAPLLALAKGQAPSTIDPAVATYAATGIGHELEHAITPTTADEYSDENGDTTTAGWLEEAGAELLNLHVGTERMVAAALGLPWDPSKRPSAYTNLTESATRLLALAGIDIATEHGARQASNIFQHGTSGRSPDRLVRAIADHRGLSRTVRDELRVRLDGTRGAPAKVREIEQWLVSLPRTGARG